MTIAIVLSLLLQSFFVTPLTPAEMSNKQAVVNTTEGEFVIDLQPGLAPNHVGYFMKLAREGAYDRTAFHRYRQARDYPGRGPAVKGSSQEQGLRARVASASSKRSFQPEPATRGAVAAVLQPGKPDSGSEILRLRYGSTAALTGKYTILGRVSEGLDVVQKISEAPTTPEGLPLARIEIVSITIRDVPPPEAPRWRLLPNPSRSSRALYRAVLETSMGPITLGFTPDKAPEHVRNFLRLAQAGVFDGMAFHRVVRGFAAADRIARQQGACRPRSSRSW